MTRDNFGIVATDGALHAGRRLGNQYRRSFAEGCHNVEETATRTAWQFGRTFGAIYGGGCGGGAAIGRRVVRGWGFG